VPGQGIGERGYRKAQRPGAVSGDLHVDVVDQRHGHQIFRRLRLGEKGGRPEESRERERETADVCAREREFSWGG
jgi:hypothetical protein